MSYRIFLAFIDWNAIFAIGVGSIMIIIHLISLLIRHLAKARKEEQQQLTRPLDSGEVGRVEARTEATNVANAQRVERARVLKEQPVLGSGQTQRGRIEAAFKARVAAQNKRRVEIERMLRAQRAARQNPLTRQQQPSQNQPPQQQQRSAATTPRPAAAVRTVPAKPTPVAPQQVAQRRPPNAPSGPGRLVTQPNQAPFGTTVAATVQTGKSVNARNLRQALIWREILDRPVALREPMEPV